MRLSADTFAGFNSRPFPITSHPLLVKGKLLLPTVHGIIIWKGPEALECIQLQPRATFLNFLCPGVTEIYLTENGYWGGLTDSLLSFVGGHTSNSALFTAYNVTGEKLATYPADRLLFALNAASGIGSGNIQVDASNVKAKDQFSNVSTFGVGGDGAAKFSLFPKTAKLIVDAFQQTTEEEITLSTVTGSGHPTMIMERGNWKVFFKVF
jgi:hypothetical protein